MRSPNETSAMTVLRESLSTAVTVFWARPSRGRAAAEATTGGPDAEVLSREAVQAHFQGAATTDPFGNSGDCMGHGIVRSHSRPRNLRTSRAVPNENSASNSRSRDSTLSRFV